MLPQGDDNVYPYHKLNMKKKKKVVTIAAMKVRHSGHRIYYASTSSQAAFIYKEVLNVKNKRNKISVNALSVLTA